MGGDFNCIVDKRDATKYPESKMSRGLQRLIKLKDWQDSYRAIHPNTQAYSRYYENERAEGATRNDRSYHFGGLKIKEIKYLPIAFSDHFGLIVRIILPGPLDRILCPKNRPSFRLKPEVIRDDIFKERLEEAMLSWERVRTFQGVSMDTLCQ